MKEKHKIYYNYKLEDIYLRDMLKFFLLGVNLIHRSFRVMLIQFFVSNYYIFAFHTKYRVNSALLAHSS